MFRDDKRGKDGEVLYWAASALKRVQRAVFAIIGFLDEMIHEAFPENRFFCFDLRQHHKDRPDLAKLALEIVTCSRMCQQCQLIVYQNSLLTIQSKAYDFFVCNFKRM